MISSEVLDRIKRRLGAWEANDPTAIAKDFGPGGVMPRQDLVALVGRRTQAWNDHDPDAVSACYAANGVWRDLRRDAPARGRGAIRDAIAVYFRAFPDVQWHVLRTLCEGRLICQEWRATGTHLGDFDGLAPTGQTVTRSGCDVTLIGTNRLIEVETTYWDALGLYEQLGLGVQA